MRRTPLAACLAPLTAAALLGSAATGLAADAAGIAPAGSVLAAYDAMVTIGAGIEVRPDYEGADSYGVGPMPILGLKFRVNPLTGAPTSDTGFGIRPAFRYIGKRDGTGKLAGLDTIDAAFELGLNLSWTERTWQVFVEGRQGFGGHSGQVFDLGADAILRPTPGLTASLGPRVSFATADYVSTYFDVSPAESAASLGAFSTYDAGSGLKSYGVAGRLDYELTPQWLLRLDASYNRLASDLADSPVVRNAGSADQFTVGIGAAYKFGFNWR
jgi:outer membrane protein